MTGRPRRGPVSPEQRLKDNLRTQANGSAYGQTPNSRPVAPHAGTGTARQPPAVYVPLGNERGAVIPDAYDPGGDAGTADVYSTPGFNDLLFACQLDGDAFPRVVMFADAQGGIWFGDGTYDPRLDGVNIFLDSSTSLGLTCQPGTGLRGVSVYNGDVLVEDPGRGVVIRSPDLNRWRVTVDNSGNITAAPA